MGIAKHSAAERRQFRSWTGEWLEREDMQAVALLVWARLSLPKVKRKLCGWGEALPRAQPLREVPSMQQ